MLSSCCCFSCCFACPASCCPWACFVVALSQQSTGMIGCLPTWLSCHCLLCGCCSLQDSTIACSQHKRNLSLQGTQNMCHGNACYLCHQICEFWLVGQCIDPSFALLTLWSFHSQLNSFLSYQVQQG